MSPQSIKRLQAGELILKGFDNDEIVDILDVSFSSVKRWRKKIDAGQGALTALLRKKGSGRIPRLDDEQQQRLRDTILAGAVKAGYASERWTSKIVADFIRNEFGVTLSARAVRDLLPKLGLSPQMPVVKSHKHSDEEVLRWAEQTWERIKKKRRDSTHS